MIRATILAWALVWAPTAHVGAQQDEQTARLLGVSAEPSPSNDFAARLAREQKLADLGWRLARSNAEFCNDASISIGLQLFDAASFRDPDAIRRELGLQHDIAVLTAAKGSPAAKADFKSLEQVTHIESFAVDQWAVDEPLYWKRAEQVHKLLGDTLQSKGVVSVTRAGQEPLTVTGVLACATRFELTGGKDTALADGTRVRLSAHYPAFAYPEDELAAVMAHELAHNLLGHRAWLDANGRKRKHVRMTEREADRLAPWLLANAGFEPEAALRFMRRWGPEHASGFLRKRTHDHWRDREKAIAAEIPLVLQAVSNEGLADWKTRFRREIKQ